MSSSTRSFDRIDLEGVLWGCHLPISGSRPERMLFAPTNCHGRQYACIHDALCEWRLRLPFYVDEEEQLSLLDAALAAIAADSEVSSTPLFDRLFPGSKALSQQYLWFLDHHDLVEVSTDGAVQLSAEGIALSNLLVAMRPGSGVDLSPAAMARMRLEKNVPGHEHVF
jgi:hypothetical protein